MRLRFAEIGSGAPLFLLHGLFGSGDNWAFIARRLAGRFRCVLPDLRNHGGSGWSGPFTFRDMAADILETADGLGLRSFAVLGHSLGAKAAMTCALLAPDRVMRVAAADMAPRAYEGGDLLRLARIMQRLDLSRLRSRADADAALAAEVPDPSVRGFLLKNLREGDGGMVWRLNLEAIAGSFSALSAWNEDGRVFPGPALFLRGEKSGYVCDDDMPGARKFFPAAEFVTVPEAGHWVHADNPDFVVRAMEEFFA